MPATTKPAPSPYVRGLWVTAVVLLCTPGAPSQTPLAATLRVIATDPAPDATLARQQLFYVQFEVKAPAPVGVTLDALYKERPLPERNERASQGFSTNRWTKHNVVLDCGYNKLRGSITDTVLVDAQACAIRRGQHARSAFLILPRLLEPFPPVQRRRA